MKFAGSPWVIALALAVGSAPEPAFAACNGYQTSFVAGAEGAFRVCPQEIDAAGNSVGSDFYHSCTVQVAWQGGGGAKVRVDAPSPGASYLVSFPAAWGGGGATAYCTNRQDVSGAVSASAIRFRDLGPPSPPILDPWAGGGQVP